MQVVFLTPRPALQKKHRENPIQKWKTLQTVAERIKPINRTKRSFRIERKMEISRATWRRLSSYHYYYFAPFLLKWNHPK